jgi:hypothetical protein
LCIENYDGLADPKSVDLDFFNTWLEMCKLLVGYRNKALITNLMERKVGRFWRLKPMCKELDIL